MINNRNGRKILPAARCQLNLFIAMRINTCMIMNYIPRIPLRTEDKILMGGNAEKTQSTPSITV